MSKSGIGIDVSRETLEKLEGFAALVKEWTRKINLVAPSTLDHLWTRHIIDSAQFWELAPTSIKNWTDLGSGGGFPGLVVATIAQAKSQNSMINLIESDQRKCAFLRTAKLQLSLSNVNVLNGRIEALPAMESDVVSARALAPLPQLLPLVRRHLRDRGTAILAKGANASVEIAETKDRWRFDLTSTQSKTDAGASLLQIKNLEQI